MTRAGSFEPYVANPATDPCQSASSGVIVGGAPTSSSLPSFNSGPAGAYTFSSYSQPSTTGPVAPGASALASVDGVMVPTGSGTNDYIEIVGPAHASVSYACENGQVVASSSSSINLLYANGNAVPLFDQQDQKVIDLGGGNYAIANEKLQTATTLTERLLDVYLSNGSQIVVGEAQVARPAGNPCTGTASETPPAVNICPNGSTYNPADQYCEIETSSGPIIISRPYEGPTGGTVLALSVARRRYHSPCLWGPGPQYAIVGTEHADRINGTARSERILGLGGDDRIAGQAGDDCIDGGPGNDRIFGGNGNERIYGGTGNDRISVQNGNSFVDGGPGNDRIFMGDGNNTIYGGSGNDLISVGRGNNVIHAGPGRKRIDTADGNNKIYGGAGWENIWVGNGLDWIWAGPADGRVYAPGEKDHVACSGGNPMVWVNMYALPWARHHGCRRARMVKPQYLR